MKTKLIFIAIFFALLSLPSCFEKDEPKPLPLEEGTNGFLVNGGIFSNTQIDIDTTYTPSDPDKSLFYRNGSFEDYNNDGTKDSMLVILSGKTGQGGDYSYVQINIHATPASIGTYAFLNNLGVYLYFYDENGDYTETYEGFNGSATINHLISGSPFETDIDFAGSFRNINDASKVLQLSSGNVTLKE